MPSLMIGSILLLSAAQGAGFYEQAGVVSMEAEHATSTLGWNLVPGLSGSAMRDGAERGAGNMTFDIDFVQGRRYYVWLLCRHTSADGASADDAFVTLDGEKLYGSDDVTRPDGMQAASGSFSWSSRPKGPGGTTPSNIAAGPVHALVPGPGRRVFRITSRSQGFEIDKIVLQLDDSSRPTGTGPAETVMGGTYVPPPPPTGTPGTESPPSPEEPPVTSGTNSAGVFVGFPDSSGGGGSGEGENGDDSLNDSVCGLLGVEALILLGLAGLGRRR